jgi:Reverse transcriptase (RNA-dependent DNA polymerase)
MNELAPYMAELFNRSLATGFFPSMYKASYITPLLDKPSLDAADVKSYRPISNLSVLSKLLERLVARQLVDYLKSAELFPLYQSAYRLNHSTETAVLHVLSEILTAADRGEF